MQKYNFMQKETWTRFINKLIGMFAEKADKTEIPTALPNPQPITFSGIIPSVSYDGAQAVNVVFPTPEMMEESAGTPVGEIISYMGNTAPKHYLICDGTVYNVADYPELAQHFATEFGTSNYFGGDGETTFAVPDLRGEFLMGTGTNSYENSGDGANVGVHQTPTSHITMTNAYDNIYVADGDQYVENADTVKKILNVSNIFNRNSYGSGAISSSFTSRPTNTSILYCIKYKSTHFIRIGGGNYSLEERRIGTWIDGKPLYEKTIDFGQLPNATTKEVPHGIENIDIIWVYDGFSVLNSQANSLLVVPTDTWLYCNVFKNKITFTASSDRSMQSAFVVLRYTKTTD